MNSLSLRDWKDEWHPTKGAESLSSSEAATALGISVKTLYRWEAKGKIHCSRTAGNHRRVHISEVMRLRLLKRTKRVTFSLSPPSFPLTEDFPVPRHDRRALKTQCKVLQVLLSNVRPVVAVSMLPVLGELIGEIIEAHIPQSVLKKAWDIFQAEILTLMTQIDHQFEEEVLKKTIPSQIPTYRRKTITSFDQARITGAQVFQDLIKASTNHQLDLKERQRALGLVAGILKPYRQLTRYLAIFPPGTVEHDVSLLLLTKHPADYGLMRRRWSVRLLSQVCQEHLQTQSASKSQGGRFYKHLGWHRSVSRKLLSPDPAFGSKMKQIGRALATLGPNDLWGVGDELTFTSTKTREHSAPTHAPEGLQIHLQGEKVYCYEPNHTLEISGLYDPGSRKLEVELLPSNNFQGYLPTLAELARRFLAQTTGRVVIGLDNGPIHRPEALQEALRTMLKEEGERITVLFFPTHSPNSNAIEGVWQQLLRCVPRACNNAQELQTMLNLALKEQKRTRQELVPAPRSLFCPLCQTKFLFDPTKQKEQLDQIETHICFNIPNLNPYTVLVLTHSLERGTL